jgi:hypothetical protein
MARIGDRIRSVLIVLAVVIIPSQCQAAKLSRFLTQKDLSRPILLDQNGKQLQLPSSFDPHPSLPQGSTPTYLAVPLYGGEHLPMGAPTIDVGTQVVSNGIGPLDLNSAIKAQLDTALNLSGLALVDTSQQNYLVEYLPHLTRSHHPASSESGKATHSKSSNRSLSKLLTASQWEKWANSGYSDLKNLLNINSSNSSHKKSSFNLEAQVLTSDNQTSAPGSVLPAAIPEPSGAMIFALLAGVLGLLQARQRGFIPGRVQPSER